MQVLQYSVSTNVAMKGHKSNATPRPRPTMFPTKPQTQQLTSTIVTHMQPTQANYQIEGRHLRTFPGPVCAGRRRRPNARDASRPQDITRDVTHKHT